MKRLIIVASCLLGVAATADWYWLNPKPTANDLNAVWFVGDTGYACGPTTIKTTDGGANWTTLATSSFENVQFPVDGHTGYAAGYGMHKTTDGGATWAYVEIGDYEYTHQVCFPAGNDTGYATFGIGDPPKVAKTCDGFATFTAIVSLYGFDRAFGMVFTDTRHGWVVGGGAGGGGGFILRTTDGGATWTRQDSGHTVGRRRSISALADGQTAFVCGCQPSLQKTTDGGAHWDTLPFPAVDEALCVSFPAGPDTGFVIAQLYASNRIYRTTNGGQNWRIEGHGMTNQLLTGVFAVDTGTVYVVGNLKTFLKYDGRGGVEERANDEVRTTSYGPTIVRGVLLSPVDSKQHAAYMVELLDISGRKVLDLAPGANEVSKFAPGVYFVSEEPSAGCRRPSAVRKVIVTR